MAARVIAFPPVAAVGSEWTVEAPVQRSRSLISGRRYVSAWGRRRREAFIRVAALGERRTGAGYSEMLKRHLDGGVHLVRLTSLPINWHLDANTVSDQLSTLHPLEWEGLQWTSGGQPLQWYTGEIYTGVVGNPGGRPTIYVSGLPPRTLLVRPGDFVRVFETITDTDGLLSQATAEAKSDADGNATVRLFDALPAGPYVRVLLGESDSRVFEALEMPRSAQPVGQNWFYEWRFREVFADEVGGFEEVNPWA